MSPIVVFDLDGTLVDTAPDLMDSLNHVLAGEGIAPVDYADLTFLVGHGARAMIERAYALRKVELAPGALPALLDRFIAHYLSGMPGESRPFPGVVDALERLKTDGFRLAICTNKMEGLARPLIEKLSLAPYFDVITGGDTFAVRKPDGIHVLSTIGMAGGDPARAVMVGDSVNDILAAANARIPSIGVPFGYSDVAIETLDPTTVIRHFDELTPALARRLITA